MNHTFNSRTARLFLAAVVATSGLVSVAGAPAGALPDAGDSCTSAVSSTSTSSSTGGGTAAASGTVSSGACDATLHGASSATSAGDGTATSHHEASASAAVAIIHEAMPSQLRRATVPLSSQGHHLDSVGSVRVSNGSSVLRPSGPGSQKVRLRIPTPSGARHGVTEGVALTDAGNYTVGQMPVSGRAGGGLVMTFTMKDASSPSAFPVEVRVPGGARLTKKGASVLVRGRSGTILGMLPKPWARDAAGNAVRTRYVVKGNMVTQQVFTRPDVVFPVVADPWFIPAWAVAQIIRCGAGGLLGWIGSAGWAWWGRAMAVAAGCLTGVR